MKPSFTKSWTVILTLLALTFSAIGVIPAHAAGIVINSLLDATAVDGNCTLREAIQNANNNVATNADCVAGSGADTITFSVSGAITLGSALPSIGDATGLAMDGTGQTVTISGNNAVRVMVIDVGASLTLNNLTIANGNEANGGGIFNNGMLTITNSAFSGNSVTGMGGGIFNNGTLTITNSTFSGNSAGSGGGIYIGGGTATITNSTFSGNSAGGDGGGIINYDTLTITNSTFSGNSATTGGSINKFFGATTILRNTIVANSTGGNCGGGGAITNGGNNIDDAATCGWDSTDGSMSSTDPLLGALANNGGPTQTFALLTGSPAIDGVTFNAPNSAPATDQRGIARPQGALYDIGSYEADAIPPDTTIDSTPPDPSNDITPTFTFSGDDGTGSGVASFMCQMDSGGYSACAAPFTSSALLDGSHTFYVYAIDNAGNADASPASYTWTITIVFNLFLPLILR